MESQPQNPELRNNPENFTHGDYLHALFSKSFIDNWSGIVKNTNQKKCSILNSST